MSIEKKGSNYKNVLDPGWADEMFSSRYDELLNPNSSDLESSANPYFRSLEREALSTLAAACVDPGIEHEISKHLAAEFNVNSTKYDDAIDASFNMTGIGGSQLHHNLDGSHTFAGALDALREAYPNDPAFDRYLGAMNHLARDFTTPSGINPFLSPDGFGAAKGYLGDLGLPARQVNDLLNVNAGELGLATLATGMLVFGCAENDSRIVSQQFGRLLGTSFFAGNPFGLLVASAVLVRTALEGRSDLLAVSGRSTLGVGQVIAAGALLPELSLAISLVVVVSACGVVRHLLGAGDRFEAELDHTLASMFTGYRSYFGELS